MESINNAIDADKYYNITSQEAREIARKACKTELKPEDLAGLFKAIKENAEEGKFYMYMSEHHRNMIPVLEVFDYKVTEVFDDNGLKYRIQW